MRQATLNATTLKPRSGTKTKQRAAPLSIEYDAEENCPVIVAHEVYLGGASQQCLRVVCFATPVEPNSALHRAS